ncbi:CDP-glucose 4,6-dehydratase [Roseimicrobium gellanilyticum]|uniref:CDP-glucose 4,6-dehydratase n=1 Tax=Roseimicrobium gellanilyticum TaxID=748857 RepID=A0A366H3U0_9BACT|nr:CDP-glucose 4,6-dehydratase [Roseimicrobium gellanilyticum]RBP36660.1 CDP-glucose 4,6-dehydratase [Roseimicrobium gellanilyticum]
MVAPFGQIYQGKRVLVTGHTGFKGGWLSLWLRALGAEVSGYALAPEPGESLFALIPPETFKHSRIADLRDAEAMKKAIADSNPDIIFHLAAQPIVGISYRAPMDTFTTNAVGTAVLLEAMREANSPAAAVIVTSDKCYRNDNTGRPFQESDPLGGHDVYSMSKAATELVVSAWHSSFFAHSKTLGPLATGRAGNVIGGGDYAEDRIVPDAVRAFVNQKPLVLRRPQATRPWQHVLESVSGYLALGQRLLTSGDRARLLNFNFGPDFEAERSVQELMDCWLTTWPDAMQVHSEPQPAYGEATRLSLDHGLAVQELGWKPVWDFRHTVAHTAAWYRERHERRADAAGMLTFTLDQINTYTRDAALTGVSWAQ